MLFENQESLSNALFLDLADRLDLSPSRLQTAVTEQTYRARVRADFSSGVHSGVNGTPTFFINGQRHNGSFDFDALSNAIEQMLSAGKHARSE